MTNALEELWSRIAGVLSPQEQALALQGLTRIVCRALADLLDAGCAGGTEAAELPGWPLMEVNASDELTGRPIGGLHGDMLDFRLGSGEPGAQG